MKRILRSFVCFSVVLVMTVLSMGPAMATGETCAWAGDWTTIGSIAAGGFLYPANGIAADSSGNVYVADTFNVYGIRKLAAGGATWQSLPNKPFSASNGDYPWGVAVDGGGNVYVVNCISATTGARAVWKYTSTTQVWTDITFGTQFAQPEGITVDSNGNLYVTDTGNIKIRKLVNGGTTWTVIGDNTSANNGLFTKPRGITVDSNNNLYVTDSSMPISYLRRLPSGATTWDGNIASIRISDPSGVAVDRFGNIYVAKGTSKEILVRAKNSTTWASIRRETPNTLNAPFGVAVDGSGNVYVTDSDASGYGVVYKHQGWATQLVWNTQPAGGLCGHPLTQQPTLRLLDAAGNLMTGVSGDTVTISLNATNGAVLSGSTTATFINGTATFTDLSVDKPGGYTLTATGSITNTSIWDDYHPISLPNASITSESSATFAMTAPPQAAAPTASPASGSVIQDNSAVTLSCATTGATIYYTTDGSDPTKSGSSCTSGAGITVSGPPGADITIKAFAAAGGMDDSAIVTFQYIIDPSTSSPVSPSFNPAAASFDKNPANQADVTTTVTWFSAHSVTDVKAGGTSIGPAGYSVAGNILTIKKEYLAAQATGSLELTAEFDNGTHTLLTIQISDTTPLTYTVTFNPQSGTVSPATKTVTYGETYGTLPTPTRTGYAFGGWYTGTNGTGTKITSSSAVTITSSQTLYAKWTAINYAITVKASNSYGTASGGGSFAYGTSVTVKAVPKAGYRLVGWKDGAKAVSTSANYTFTVTGQRTLTAEFAAIGTPGSPAAASSGYNSIKVSWKAVTGASGYEVYRATSKTGKYALAGTSTGTSYTNTGLTTGTTCYYKVRAKCVAGSTVTYSGYSAIVSAKPVPAAPALTAASASYSGVKLTWSKVSGASGYEVYRSTSKTGAYTKLTTTTAASYTNTRLTAGKTYYYKVRAYRTVGKTKIYGSYSAVVSAKPVPAAPTGMKASRASSTGIKLTWGKVAGATKYEVWRATSSGGAYSLVATVAGASCTNTGLKAGTAYHYKVRAYRLVSGKKVYGPYSAMVSAKP